MFRKLGGYRLIVQILTHPYQTKTQSSLPLDFHQHRGYNESVECGVRQGYDLGVSGSTGRSALSFCFFCKEGDKIKVVLSCPPAGLAQQTGQNKCFQSRTDCTAGQADHDTKAADRREGPAVLSPEGEHGGVNHKGRCGKLHGEAVAGDGDPSAIQARQLIQAGSISAIGFILVFLLNQFQSNQLADAAIHSGAGQIANLGQTAHAHRGPTIRSGTAGHRAVYFVGTGGKIVPKQCNGNFGKHSILLQKAGGA